MMHELISQEQCGFVDVESRSDRQMKWYSTGDARTDQGYTAIYLIVGRL